MAPTVPVLTAASRPPTSWATCVLTRLGVLPRSWRPTMTSIRLTIGALGQQPKPAIAGGPDDHKAGWVVGGGFKLNTPWLLNWLGSGAGDYFQTQVNYTQGALKYLNQTTNSNWGINEGSQASWGLLADGGCMAAGVGYGGTGTLPTATS